MILLQRCVSQSEEVLIANQASRISLVLNMSMTKLNCNIRKKNLNATCILDVEEKTSVPSRIRHINRSGTQDNSYASNTKIKKSSVSSFS
jgi:hypothetical protein